MTTLKRLNFLICLIVAVQISVLFSEAMRTHIDSDELLQTLRESQGSCIKFHAKILNIAIRNSLIEAKENIDEALNQIVDASIEASPDIVKSMFNSVISSCRRLVSDGDTESPADSLRGYNPNLYHSKHFNI